MTFHHDCGKGSRPREYSVTQEEFGKKFDAIDWSKKAEAFIIGEDVPPMTQEKIDELNAVLDEYEE
jgi:hypothetical protein